MSIAQHLDPEFSSMTEGNAVAATSEQERPLISDRLRRKMAVYATVTILLPAVVTAVAVSGAVRHGVPVSALVALGVMYMLTAIGITAGFHRHFAHKSFSAKPALRIFLGVAGCMAAQGPVLNWASTHRRHHQNTDKNGDPHSPYVKGDQRLGFLRGLFHSHIGWMITDNMTNPVKYAPDLLRDKLATFINRWYLLWVSLGILLPGVVSGLMGGTIDDFVQGVLWGGFVRLFLVHHAFWLIGSVAHIIGVRVFATNDQSRNNFFSALLNLGEGWHNNHHAFSSSARFGLRWYQIDLGYVFIWTMRALGLAYDVRQPSSENIVAKTIKKFGIR
jgi:stearoyl-CoA desaturase (delta-9 desaturase)